MGGGEGGGGSGRLGEIVNLMHGMRKQGRTGDDRMIQRAGRTRQR